MSIDRFQKPTQSDHYKYLHDQPRDFTKIDFSNPDTVLQLSIKLEKNQTIDTYKDGQEHNFKLDESYELHFIHDCYDEKYIPTFVEGTFKVSEDGDELITTFKPRPYDNNWTVNVYAHDKDIDRAICQKIMQKLKIQKCSYISYQTEPTFEECIEKNTISCLIFCMGQIPISN